jgi:hypothetical protein
MASTAATMVFGGDNPERITPDELEAWKREHSTASAGERPSVRYDVNLEAGTVRRVIDSTPPLSEHLIDVFSLGLRPVGRGVGTFVGGLIVAADEDLSTDIRTRGAYDAGVSSVAVPVALLVAAAPGLRLRANWLMEPNGGPQLPVWGGPVDYSLLPDALSVGPGKVFTQTQKARIYAVNRQENGGLLRSDLDGKVLVTPTKSQSGVTPSPSEAQVDHRIPRIPFDPAIRPGSNSYGNAQVLSGPQNRLKWNN